jgi:hypothetical protein
MPCSESSSKQPAAVPCPTHQQLSAEMSSPENLTGLPFVRAALASAAAAFTVLQGQQQQGGQSVTSR